MPFLSIYIHIVWTTKNFTPLLPDKISREKLKHHILTNAKSKSIFINQLAIQKDHCHCLLSLSHDQNISKIVQLLKGESSRWLNSEQLLAHKFEWQKEYYAVSVSLSHKERVMEYIKNQDEHHRKKTFSEEYENFIRKYGFKKLDD
ncbi:IS200/IS605 family transposase [Arthrospiribacter ruber]|uniref:IS200/IS605 family transposase n=1 Tax=Arthrospiribacter ruber TaxID=2487934 RepID=A0A951MCR2_9BACT|nr:IS200/IS605 family transposase [Arthrospiribacter ruber]MBW3467787.1 IS200/IS605 family transposase [Arthrospiribacter ruber]